MKIWDIYIGYFSKKDSIEDLESIKDKLISINKQFYEKNIEHICSEISNIGKKLIRKKIMKGFKMYEFINKYNSYGDFLSDSQLLINPESILKELNQAKELYKEILKNKKLEEKIKDLENELAKEKQNKENSKNNNTDIVKKLELMEKLESKEKEIKNILSRYPCELFEGEHLLSVIFISKDESLHHSIICKNTEKFSDVESRFYKAFPEYLESENYFLINGKRVNRFKSLDENNN